MSEWTERDSPDHVPTAEGWYRVMYPGDSESIDGHEIYSFPDYEEWTYWSPASEEEYEDFEGGYKGGFSGPYEADSESVFAWCGPFNPRHTRSVHNA